MPTIPSSNGSRVAPIGGTPQLRAPVEAFGGGDAARPFDTSGADKFIQGIREHEIQRADQIAVTDAGGQVYAWQAEKLHGPNGALSTQGKDAFNIPETVAKSWQETTAKIEEGLTNDTQKMAFRQLAQTHWNAINGQVQQHVATQRHAYDNSVSDTAVNTALNVATEAFRDDNAVELAVADTRGSLTNYWVRAGHGDGKGGVDVVGQQHIASRISQIRSAVIQQYAIAEDDQGASKYFEQHKGELVGKDLIQAEKIVKVGKQQGDGLRAADRILGLGKPDALPGDVIAQEQQKPAGTLSEALARADATIVDTDVRKEARQALTLYFNQKEDGARQDRSAAQGRLGAQIEKTGKLNKADPDYLLIAGHPEQSHIDLEAEKKLHPPKDPGDQEAYMASMQLAGLSPETFLQQGMKDWAGMNSAQKTHLVNLQNGILNKQRAQVLSEAQADLTHFNRLYEDAALKYASEIKAAAATGGMVPEVAEILRWQHDAQQKVDRLKHAQGAAVTARPSATPSIQPTRQMLDEAAQSPAYAEHLRSLGVALPAVLPKPKVAP